MKKHAMMWRVLSLVVASVAALSLTVAPVLADNDDDGEVIPFDECQVFFEFNSTDLDLGIQIFFDGVAWEEVDVSGPDGTIFEVENDGSLSEIGGTELRTESAEPELDEDNLEEAIAAFLALFPEGTYTCEGETVDYDDRLEGEAELTHDLPVAVDVECELANNDDLTTIKWCDNSVAGDPEHVSYEVIHECETEGGDVFVFSVNVLPGPAPACSSGFQSMTVPEEFSDALPDGTECKAEVLAQEESGNKTITEEDCEEE